MTEPARRDFILMMSLNNTAIMGWGRKAGVEQMGLATSVVHGHAAQLQTELSFFKF